MILRLKRLLFLACMLCQLLVADSRRSVYSNSWVIHTEEGKDYVYSLAEKHSFINRGEIEGFPGHFLLEHKTLGKRNRRTVPEHTLNLLSERHVKFAKHQKVVWRTKRGFLDPLYSDQWYLKNSGQTTGSSGFDINVKPVWQKNITGRGIVVTILDDGIEYTHDDLKRNYEPKASYDFNGHDKDPFPRYSHDNINKHGTRCAGEVAADINNNACGVGVAYNSRIGGVRMLDGDVTDAVEGWSLSLARETIDIYSSSWGPDDDGRTVDGPGQMARKAFRDGIRKGRNGLGAIFVWATGNGGHYDDYCNCDGYITSIFTVSIGAVNDRGKSPWYSESCPATLAVTYSSGQTRGPDKQIVTTDLHNKCTKSHTGTSAAAPLAAGIFALVLEANPKLSWRDLQHLIVNTSKQIDKTDNGWQTNGAGHLVNNKFGFGVLDSAALVDAATSPGWKTATAHHVCRDQDHIDDAPIPSRGSYKSSLYSSGCLGKTNCITKLEHVRVYITLSHRRRGSLRIQLTSPQGTMSELLAPRSRDYNSGDGFQNWPFMSVFHWGENPIGTWTLQVSDIRGFTGTFKRWSLRLYGTCKQTGGRDPNEEEHCAQECTKNCTRSFAQSCPNCSSYCHCGIGKCVKLCNVSDKVDQERKECKGDVLVPGAMTDDPLDDDDDDDDSPNNNSNYYNKYYPIASTLHVPTLGRHLTQSSSFSMFMKLLIIFILVAILLSTVLMLWLCKGSGMLCWGKQNNDKVENQKNVVYRPVANNDKVEVQKSVAYHPVTVVPEVNSGNLHSLGNLYHVPS